MTEHTRRQTLVFLVTPLVALVVGTTTAAYAQPYLPALGGAPGVDSGDTTAPFTGLASAPQADLFSGAATTRVPIEVPPGRLEATPNLVLQYSSFAGPSPYGFGWSIALPRVSRSTRHGVPRFDSSDEFVLALEQASADLEPIANTPRFRAKKEGAYLRIGFDRGANGWKVVDKGGTTFLFGSTDTARLGPDTSNPDGTGAWLLTRTIDPFGNHIDYEYLPADNGTPTPGLPSRIRYGGNLRSGLSHVFVVDFDWGPLTYPKTPIASYQTGYRVELSRTLVAIETSAPRGIVRRYNLNHDIDPNTGHARLVGVSLDGFAPDPSNDVALPSTVFVYSPAAVHDWPVGPESVRRAKATVFSSPGAFRDSGNDIVFDTFDIDGDSIVDYVNVISNPATVRRGGPDGFASAVPWTWPASARRIRKIDSANDIVVNVFDITGDGLPDLVDARASACGTNAWCVYRNTGNGFSLTPTSWPAPGNRIRGATIDGSEVRADVIDMNGDARPDFIDASVYRDNAPYWHVYENTGEGFAAAPTPVPAVEKTISRSELDDDRSFLLYGLFDMNGDGLPDFVRADVTQLGAPSPLSRPYWDVHLNNGHGFDSQPNRWSVEGAIAYRLSNFVSSSFVDPDRRATATYDELVDVNGDGRPDIVRHYNGADYLAFGLEPLACSAGACSTSGSTTPPACCFNVLVFLNTGATFSAPTPWAAWHDFQLRAYSRAPSPSSREFDLFDFDGDGLIDLVEIENGEWRLFRHPAAPANGGSTVVSALRYRPNLLVAMMNGIGGQTVLTYAPVAGRDDNRLPFPLWTLASHKTFDGISSIPASVTQLRYRNALYDPVSGELRGFGLVWQEDAIGRVIATEFLQDDLHSGLVQRVHALAAPTCTATRPLDPTDPCSPWQRPLALKENVWGDSAPTLLIEHRITPFHNGAPISELAKRLEYTYDNFGNVVAERISSPSAGTVVTDSDYAYSIGDSADGQPARYIANRVRSTRTYDAATPRTRLVEKRYVYDQDEPVTGALLQARSCMEWTTTECSRWQDIEYRYGRTGNATSVRGPTGGTSSLRYDSFDLYASRVSNAAAATTTISRDIATGRQTITILPDGQRLETTYDGIGRPIRHYRSGGSTADPEIQVTYFEGTSRASPSWVHTLAMGSGPAVVFHDGLGRPLAKKAWVDTMDGVRTVISGLREYGPAGEIVAEAAPFAAASSVLTVFDVQSTAPSAWTEYVRDAQGRLIETRLPDGSRLRHDDSVPGVRVNVDPNLAGGRFPGAARIEFSDGFGRVWRRDDCATVPNPAAANQCAVPALLARTEYEHDGLDRVVRITVGPHLASPAVSENTYDGVGNRVRYSSGNLGEWRYVYDPAGSITSATDPRGARVTNTYDRTGRLRRQVSTDVRSSYKYHRRGDGVGLLRRVTSKTTSARISKTFNYDARSRLVEDEWRVRLARSNRRHVTQYTYDDADRRVSTTYPTGHIGSPDVLRTEYLPFGLPFRLVLESNDGPHELVRAASYDLYGNLTRIDYGNDLSDRWTYRYPESLARLLCIRTTSSYTDGDACNGHVGDLRRTRVVARDDAGHLLDLVDFAQTDTPSDSSAAYDYDPLGRLTQAAHATGEVEHFAYDALGNLAVDSRSGAFLYSREAPNVVRSVGGIAISHDAAGNRTAKGPWTYQYDTLGRLVGTTHNGKVVSRYQYDEGRNRVATENSSDGGVTYHFGGLFDLEGDTLTRYFHFGDRLVAVDSVFVDPQSLAFTGQSHSHPIGSTEDSSDTDSLRIVSGTMGFALAIGLLAGGLRGRRSGRRRALACLTTISFVSTTTLATDCHFAAADSGHYPSPTSNTLLYVHTDALRSPELLTDTDGSVAETRRYASYGAEIGRFGPDGSPPHGQSLEFGFNGHRYTDASDLVDFGSRHYDAALGLFLTPDPQAEHASPYLFGGGNPLFANDPDGEALFGLLFALLEPILASALASALISSVAATAGGGDVAGAFVDGLVAGGAGAIVGTAIGGANIGLQYAMGGSQYIELSEAMAAAVEVARRSAFSNVVAHSAATATRTAGGNSDWATGSSLAGALAGSYVYDGFVVGDSGAARTQRTIARDRVQLVNTKIGHRNVTQEATVGTGWGAQATKLAAANVGQDGGRSFGSRLSLILNNQEHFGRLPASLAGIQAEVNGVIAGSGSGLLGVTPGLSSGVIDSYIRAVGAATHYVQDHLTLGHMVPGTAIFGGPIGAPIRFVIHQVFGGEIAFRNAQIRATRTLLSTYGPPV